MAHATLSRDLDASPETVFGIFADGARRPEWLTLHDGWKSDPAGILAEGTTFSEKCTVMGMTNTIDWVVTEFNTPNAMQTKGKGMAGAQITFTLIVEPNGEGSTATVVAEFTGQMVVGAIGAAIERTSKKEIEASLDKLAGLLG